MAKKGQNLSEKELQQPADVRRRPKTAAIVDRPSQALQGIDNRHACEGCGRPFTPNRTTQTHCRPGCRVTAWRKRRTSVPDPDEKRGRTPAGGNVPQPHTTEHGHGGSPVPRSHL